MCRNVRRLHNLTPQATPAEVHDAASQYVRKIAGTTTPSRANREVFDSAVEAIAETTQELLDGLVTAAPPRTREHESQARAKRARRFDSAAG